MKKKILILGIIGVVILSGISFFNVSKVFAFSSTSTCVGSSCGPSIITGSATSTAGSTITISGSVSGGYEVQNVNCSPNLGAFLSPQNIEESSSTVSYSVDGVSGTIPVTITQQAQSSTYGNCISPVPEAGTYSTTISNPNPSYPPYDGSVSFLDATATFGTNSMNATLVSQNVASTFNQNQNLGPFSFTVENTGPTAWTSDQASTVSNVGDCSATDNITGYSCPSTVGNSCVVTTNNYSSTIQLKDSTNQFSSSPVSMPYSQITTKTCKETGTGGGVYSCAGSCSSGNCGSNNCAAPTNAGGCGGTWNSNTNCSTSPTYPIYSESSTGDPNVEPNANTTFTLNSLTAPSVSGFYTEIWQMFQGGSGGSNYFGSKIPVIISINCPSGTTWNGSSCLANMSGTLTPASPTCTIASGASSCNVSMTWTTTNPQATSSITSSYPSAGTTLSTGNSGTNVSIAIPYASSPRILYLYNNSVLLAQSTATASCVANTTWNGSTCATNTYTVSTSAGTGGTISPTSASVAYGNTTSFTVTPNTGYTIASVSGCSGSGTSSYTTGAISAACTVSATFNQMSGAISTSPTSCTIASGASSCNVTVTWSTTNPIATSAVTASGMTNVNGNSGSQAMAVPYSSRIFYLYNNSVLLAQSTATSSCVANTIWNGSTCATNTYTLTASSGANGSVTPTGTTTVNYGANQTYTITPNTGYSIASVLVDGSSVGAVGTYTFSNVTANHTISATFTINSYTVSTSAGTGGSISPTSATVNSGSTTSFTVTPNSGYSIASVSGCSGSGTSTYTTGAIVAACTVSATFTINSYTVSTSAGTGGTISPTSASVSYGSTKTFTVTPNTGYSIASVSGCSGSGTSSYTTGAISANCTVSASFSLNTYTVSTSAGTGGTISPTSASVGYGSTTTFTVTPSGGYSIASVSGCSGSGTSSYTTGAITAACTVSATFSLNPVAPTVSTTTPATNITQTSATDGGTIVSNGGATITTSGIVWGTSSNPTTANSKTTDGWATGGPWTDSITGLTASTTYHVRAYATNSVGTSYGSDVSFTTSAIPTYTVSTSAGTGGTISPTSATVNSGSTTSFTVTPNSGYSIASVSGCSGSGTSTYTTGAIVAACTVSATFSLNPTAPTVTTTSPATSITQTSATDGGTIVSNGGAAITVSGIVWATTANPTTASNLGKTTDGFATGGPWTDNITGLSSGTTYHVRAYATNSVGTSYGSDVSFTTSALLAPTVTTTTPATNITQTSATDGGTIVSNGGATITTSGIVWSTTANPTYAGGGPVSTVPGQTTDGFATGGPWTDNISGLALGTTYHVRAYAVNSVGTSYGADVSFTTGAATAPTVTTTTPATNISQTTATDGGTINSNGGSTITVSGIVWGTSANPTTANSKTTDGWATGGPWTDNITGLTLGTTYHVRAYATNSVGTSYGSDVSFTTGAATAPTVTTTTPATNITATSATDGGTIVSNGGATVTTSGIVWATTANPTTASNLGKTTDGFATGGPWTDNITGLSSGTTYHVRAYATNSVGTSYGSDVSFTTVTAVNGVCGTANGKTYPYNSPGYGSDTICASGTQNPSIVSFPAPGGTANWQCLHINSGTDSICSASQNAAPTLTASPSTIAKGASSTLTWTSSAASCTSSGFTMPPPGNSPSGSVTVSPTTTTSYSITCSDGGTAPATITVTVKIKPVFKEN